jgi:lipid-A-disaccharide synthase
MRILLVAGEASGDAHAAKVASLLVPQGAHITAVGGPQLAAAGAEIAAHIDDIAVLGFVEVLRRLPRFVSLKRRLETLLRQGRFDLFLPVDFPGLNLRLCEAARRAGVPVLYYVGPQVWAWHGKRLQRMRRNVSHVALVLPFEKPLYDAAGIPATFVGHPLLDDEVPPASVADVDLGLFPGSRPQELSRHQPTLLQAADLLRQRHPSLRIVVSRAPTAAAAWMESLLREHGWQPGRDLSVAPARHLMQRCRAMLVASGTATLEAALSGRPFAVLFRTGRVNYALARRLVKVPHIALVNLVAGEALVREFLQHQATPEALATEAASLLFDAARREQILRGLGSVRQRLGEPGAARRVAQLAMQTSRSAREASTP